MAPLVFVVGTIKMRGGAAPLVVVVGTIKMRGWRQGGGGILVVGTINMWWHPLLLLVPGVGLVP